MSEARALGTTVDRAYTPTVTRVKTVRVIPPTIQPLTDIPAFSARPRRVAAYARVSTDSDAQFTSYEAQIDYYTNYIKGRDDWELVGVYTDAAAIIGLNQKPEANGRRFSPFSLVSAHFKANGGCNCLI